MYAGKHHRIEDRIVSLSQPHVRPIVRGKASSGVEFGAKIAVSKVNGCCRIETPSWDNFNEGTRLTQRQLSDTKNGLDAFPRPSWQTSFTETV